MNRSDIIRMAREAGLALAYSERDDDGWNELARFAALVAAAEREECAKVCEEIEDQAYAMWKKGANQLHLGRESGAEMCGRAIRARSEE